MAGVGTFFYSSTFLASAFAGTGTAWAYGWALGCCTYALAGSGFLISAFLGSCGLTAWAYGWGFGCCTYALACSGFLISGLFSYCLVSAFGAP